MYPLHTPFPCRHARNRCFACKTLSEKIKKIKKMKKKNQKSRVPPQGESRAPARAPAWSHSGSGRGGIPTARPPTRGEQLSSCLEHEVEEFSRLREGPDFLCLKVGWELHHLFCSLPYFENVEGIVRIFLLLPVEKLGLFLPTEG